MNKTVFFVIFIALFYILLRIDIFINLPIIKDNWQFFFALGFLNLLLLYLIARKYLPFTSCLISIFVYASSPLIAYFEFASSKYLLLVTFLLIITLTFSRVIRRLKRYVYLIVFFLLPVIVLTLLQTNQVSLYQDQGTINGLNQLRGESAKNNLSFEGRLIENKFSYLGLHFLFNFLSQFSPAVYFTPEYKILGFSFSPPILLGFLITTLIGLISLRRSQKNLLFAGLIFSVLTFPSVLSKNSPDLERLIITIPLISLLSGFGFSKIPVFWPKCEKSIKLIFFVLLIFQYAIILLDIFLKEPIRLMLLRS